MVEDSICNASPEQRSPGCKGTPQGSKEGEKTGSLHATVLELGTEEEDGATAGLT